MIYDFYVITIDDVFKKLIPINEVHTTFEFVIALVSPKGNRA